MGHALATLPTNSNGTSVTDDESSRRFLRTSLPRRSSCEAIFCQSSRDQNLFSPRTEALHLKTPFLPALGSSKPSTPNESDRRLSFLGLRFRTL